MKDKNKPKAVNKAEYKKDQREILKIVLEIIFILILIIGVVVYITNVDKKLMPGEYVEYNVTYKDAFSKIDFKNNDGWRVLKPGRRNLDGTYSGVELISAGVPIRLYYHDEKIKEADGVKNYPWKGTKEEINKLKKSEKYYDEVFEDAGAMAVAGLKYNFGKIEVLASDPGGDKDKGTGGYETGTAWREKIVKNGVELKGKKNIEDLFLIEDMTKKDGLECTNLDTMKTYIKKYTGRNIKTSKHTDFDTFKGQAFNKIGFDFNKLYYDYNRLRNRATMWDVQELYLYKYDTIKMNPYSGSYWLATADSKNPSGLRSVHKGNGNYIEFSSSSNGNYGIRPIIKLKNHVELKRIKPPSYKEFKYNWALNIKQKMKKNNKEPVEYKDYVYSDNKLKGDYIKYDVEYTDAYITDIHFTKNNAWRILNPGTKNPDGTYNGVEIISTGIPIRLYYNDSEILKADGINNYPWKGTREDIENMRKEDLYYDNIYTAKVAIALSGLKYNFNKIKVLESDPGGDKYKETGGYKSGAAWREKIIKNGVEITGEKNINELLSIEGLTKKNGIECLNSKMIGKYENVRPDYDIHKQMDKIMKLEENKKEMWNIYKIYENKHEFKKADKFTLGYWMLHLDTDYRNVYGVCEFDISNSASKMRATIMSDGNYGIRPVIKLKDNVHIETLAFK